MFLFLQFQYETLCVLETLPAKMYGLVVNCSKCTYKTTVFPLHGYHHLPYPWFCLCYAVSATVMVNFQQCCCKYSLTVGLFFLFTCEITIGNTRVWIQLKILTFHVHVFNSLSITGPPAKHFWHRQSQEGVNKQ